MDTKTYILQQRAAGKSDSEIYDFLSKQGAFEEKQQRGFVEEAIPAGFSVLGGILGAPAGPVGSIAGAGAGGALGETIQQGIEKNFGTRKSYDTGQVAASGAMSAATQGIFNVAGKVASAGIKAAKPGIVSFISKLSGYADDVVETALKRSSGAVAGVKQGEKSMVDMITRTNQKIHSLAGEAVKKRIKTLKTLSKKYKKVIPDIKKTTNDVVSLLRSNKIGIDKNGILFFDRENIPSNIVSASDRGAIQEAVNTVKNAILKPTVQNIDATMEKLITLNKKTPAGTATGAETKKIINSIANSLAESTKTIYPKFYDFLKEDLPKRVMLSEAKELFGKTANLSGKEISQIEVRLLQLFNTGRMAVREGVGKAVGVAQVAKETGEDIIGNVAGTIINTGKQVSANSQTVITRRGIVEKVAEFIPRKVVKNYIATGKIIGDNNIINAISKITGVSVKTIMQDLVNLTSEKTKN